MTCQYMFDSLTVKSFWKSPLGLLFTEKNSFQG